MRHFRRLFLNGIGLALTLVMFLLHITQAEDATGQLSADNIMSQSTPLITGGMEGRVSLDLRNIDVVDALKFLAMKAGANIITTKNVSGRITLMVDNVLVRDIFDIMLRSNGLAYAKQGDIYNVMTEDEYKSLFGKKFSDIREVKIFKLKYAIPDQAFSMLDALKSEIGRVLVEPDSGTTLIMDTPEKIRQIEGALVKLEEKNVVQVFTLKYAKAKEVEDQLKAQIDAKKVGNVKADERSNQIIVQALPERMIGVEKIIAALDKKTKEVLIDTSIVKVKLKDQNDQGIDWEGLASMGKQLGMMYVGSTPFSVLQASTAAWQSRQLFKEAIAGTQGVGAYPFSGNTAVVNSSTKVAPGEKLHIGVIDKKRDIDVMIKYLQTIGNTQILSNPKLAVINNHEARIHVGERQAYVTTTTTTGQTTTTVSEEVTFVDVGIQLSITPTINDDGYITMKVKPEVSSVVATLITPTNNRIPIIDTSMAETTVMVKNDTTVVIGGLRREDKVNNSEGVPYLSKIPFLGNMFKSGSKSVERTELLILMTPHIITGDMITTGDESEFKYKPGKEYKEYAPYTVETDYKEPPGKPEDLIKPYKEYSDIKKKAEYEPELKGVKDEKI